MQDRYVGDAGDYAKYALLKALCGQSDDRLRLGVLWYLYPDEGHNGDGRHVAYLQQPVMAERDPAIHAQLAELVRAGRRSVSAVQQSGLLPDDTLYFAMPVAVAGAPAARLAHRGNWFESGLNALGASELLFFDPDNGIETPALKKSEFKAGKYVFWTEIEVAWRLGKSLIIYNHLNRSAPASVQTERLEAAFAERLSGNAMIVPLLFRRGSCRHIWVIAQHGHEDRLRTRIAQFLACGWSRDTDCKLDPL